MGMRRAFATLGVLLALCLGGNAHGQTDPLLNGISQLRQSAEQGASRDFQLQLDRLAPAIMQSPDLSVDEKIRVFGGIAILSRQLDDPNAVVEAEGWLMAFAEVATGKNSPLAEAARGRLISALIEADRLDEARMLANEAPPPPAETDIGQSIMALQLIQEERFTEAATILEDELQRDLQASGPDTPERTPLLQMLALAQREAGNPERALEVITPATRWSGEGRFPPEMVAMIDLEHGRILSDLDRHEDAIAVLDAGLKRAEQAFGAGHRTTLMLQLAHSNAHGAADRIWQYYQLRVEHFEDVKGANLAPLERAAALENHASLLAEFGHFDDARHVLLELLQLVETHRDLDILIAARAFSALGEIDRKSAPFGTAHQPLRAAHEIYRTELGPDALETLKAGAALARLPVVAPHVPPQVLETYLRLTTADPETLDVAAFRDVPSEIFAGTYNGQRIIQQNTSDGAIDIFRRLAEAEAGLGETFSLEAALANLEVVETLLGAGRLDEALAESLALEQAAASAPGDDLLLVQYGLLDAKGRVLQASGDLPGALAAFDKATTALSHAREIFSRDVAEPFRGDTKVDGSAAWHLAEAAWEAGQTAPPENLQALRNRAFEAVQVAEFGSAASALARARARDTSANPEQADAIADWDRAVETFAAALFQGDATAAAQLDAAESKLRQLAPDFASRALPQPLGIPEIQTDMLEDDEALVLIAPAPLGMERTNPGFVFALTDSDIAWAPLKITSRELALASATLHRELDRRPTGPLQRAPVAPNQTPGRGQSALFDAAAAQDLYQHLFGHPEIAKVLSSRDRWLIAPQGVAMNLPFAALVMEPAQHRPTTADDLRALKWLGLEKSLSILPGVSAFEPRQTSSLTAAPDQLAYVGFGDPAFSGRAGAALRSGEVFQAGLQRARAVGRLPRLPGTRDEVLRLSLAFGQEKSAAFLGPDASENTLVTTAMNGRLSGLQVLHFATHGLLSGGLSTLDEPALALTPPIDGTISQKTGWLDDGLLTASEIARLQLAVEWVILSACDTSGAANLENSIDGLNGLVRAFLQAGALNLMVSHWRVEDAVASRLTASTVESSLTGTPRDQALRQAMRAIHDDETRDSTDLPMSHPTVWAPFFLVGQG